MLFVGMDLLVMKIQGATSSLGMAIASSSLPLLTREPMLEVSILT